MRVEIRKVDKGIDWHVRCQSCPVKDMHVFNAIECFKCVREGDVLVKQPTYFPDFFIDALEENPNLLDMNIFHGKKTVIFCYYCCAILLENIKEATHILTQVPTKKKNLRLFELHEYTPSVKSARKS